MIFYTYQLHIINTNKTHQIHKIFTKKYKNKEFIRDTKNSPAHIMITKTELKHFNKLGCSYGDRGRSGWRYDAWNMVV